MHETRDVIRDDLRQTHPTREREQPNEILRREYAFDQRLGAELALEDDLFEHGRRIPVHVDLEKKTVELRLRQWISAFEIDRVLRREHEKRIRQGVCFAT